MDRSLELDHMYHNKKTCSNQVVFYDSQYIHIHVKKTDSYLRDASLGSFHKAKSWFNGKEELRRVEKHSSVWIGNYEMVYYNSATLIHDPSS